MRGGVGPLALSLTHFGSPYTWHPQGPIHPRPSPVPLHLVWLPAPLVCSPRRCLGWGGHATCSGTGRLSGRGGPCWGPGGWPQGPFLGLSVGLSQSGLGGGAPV